MIKELNDIEIQEVLEKHCYGHLGILEHKSRQYVLPITYTYSDGAIYSFSFEGKKIDVMRANSSTCFQVEEFVDENTWKSVIAWGEFKELYGDERAVGFSMLIERFWKEYGSDHPLYLPFRNSKHAVEAVKEEQNVVLYKIVINEMVGRMEHYE